MQNQKDNDQNKNEAPKTEAEEHRDERIEKTGQLTLSDAASGEKIHLLTIIGEIEGHDNLRPWYLKVPAHRLFLHCLRWLPVVAGYAHISWSSNYRRDYHALRFHR